MKNNINHTHHWYHHTDESKVIYNAYPLGIVRPVPGNPPKWSWLLRRVQAKRDLEQTSPDESAAIWLLAAIGLELAINTGDDPGIGSVPGPGYWHSAPL